MSKQEIEKVVDKLQEQEPPSFDQMDFGDTKPAPPHDEPEEFDPYPVGPETRWYGVAFCWSRGETWSKRVTGVLDTEDPVAAAIILANAAYSGAAFAQQMLREWKQGTESPMHYYDVKEGIRAQTETSIAVSAEEWEGGFGRTPEEAERMFTVAQVGGDVDDWEEM